MIKNFQKNTLTINLTAFNKPICVIIDCTNCIHPIRLLGHYFPKNKFIITDANDTIDSIKEASLVILLIKKEGGSYQEGSFVMQTGVFKEKQVNQSC